MENGLEKVVITSTRQGPRLLVTMLNLGDGQAQTLEHDLGHAAFLVSRPLTEQLQKNLLQLVRQTRFVTRAEPHQAGEHHYILIETKSGFERNTLPPEYFVTMQTGTLAPRTERLHRTDQYMVEDRLAELGYYEAEIHDPGRGNLIFEGVRKQFRASRSRFGNSLELSPHTKPDFDEFLTHIAGSYLHDVFRTYELRRGGFKDEEEAEKYIEANHARIRAGRNTATALTLTYGRGFDKRQEHIVRCVCSPAEAERLQKHGFTVYGRSANRIYGDPVGEGNQRLIEQILYKPFHTLEGRPLNSTEFRRVLGWLDERSAAVDIENDGTWIDRLTGSGNIAQIIVRSPTVNKLLWRDDLLPHEWTGEAEILPFSDELLGQQAYNELVKDFLYVFWHNGRDYDYGFIHRNDRRRNPADTKRAFEVWKRRQPKQLELTIELESAVRAEIARVHEQTNSLRGRHRHIGKVVPDEPPTVDMMTLLKKGRNLLRNGLSVEQVTLTKKSQGYEGIGGQKENWRTPHGRLANGLYAEEDGYVEDNEKRELLPYLVFSAATTGVPIERLARLTPYQAFHAERIKTVLAEGKPLYARPSRWSVLEEEKLYTSALDHFRSLPLADQQTAALHKDASLYYNPLLLVSQANLLPGKFLELLGAVEGRQSRMLALHDLEWYLAPALGEVYHALHSHAEWLRQDYRHQEADAVLRLEDFLSVDDLKYSWPNERALADTYVHSGFSGYEQYTRLFDTYHRLRDKHFEAQTGVFLLKDQQAESFFSYLGSGPVAQMRIAGETRMLGWLDDRPFVYNFVVRGDKETKLQLRDELLAAIREDRIPRVPEKVGGMWGQAAKRVAGLIGVQRALF